MIYLILRCIETETLDPNTFQYVDGVDDTYPVCYYESREEANEWIKEHQHKLGVGEHYEVWKVRKGE